MLFNKITHKASFQLPWPPKLSRWLDRWFETKPDIGPRAQQMDRECISAFQGLDFSSDGTLPSALLVNDEVVQPLITRVWSDWKPFSGDLENRINHFIYKYCRFGPIAAMVNFLRIDRRNLLIGLPSVVLHVQLWQSKSLVLICYSVLESEACMESLGLKHRSCPPLINSSVANVVDQAI